MIQFREAQASDLPFIYNSWLKSARKAYPDLSNQEYFQMKKIECTELIKNSNCLIACHLEDPNFIFGYLVYKIIADDVCILHWGYVKNVNRGFGIFTKLINAVYPNPENYPIFITHKSYLTDKLEKKFQFVFKPELRSK